MNTVNEPLVVPQGGRPGDLCWNVLTILEDFLEMPAISVSETHIAWT